jgi:hypothetical protein
VALITTRDQVYTNSSEERQIANAASDLDALNSGSSVQPIPLRLATVEQKCSATRQHIRCASKTLVVGSQQL